MSKLPAVLFSFCAGIALLADSLPAFAQDDEGGEGSAVGRHEERSVVQVLMLSAGSDSVDEQREQRQVTELQILLDGFEVVVTPVFDGAFFTSPPEEQADSVGSLARIAGADATVWVLEEERDSFLLCVRLSTSGQLLTRSVDASETSNPEAEIALAASELLGKLEGADAAPSLGQQEPGEPSEPPPAVADTSPPPSEPGPGEDTAGHWTLDALFLTGGAFGPGSPSVVLGADLAVGYQTAVGWFIRIGASGGAEPDTGVERGLQVVARIGPDLVAGYSWHLSVLRFAPALQIGVPWSLYRVALETTDDSEHWRVNLSLGVAAELALSLHENIELVATAGVGFVVFRDRFRRTSDGSIERAAIVEWKSALGVRFMFE